MEIKRLTLAVFLLAALTLALAGCSSSASSQSAPEDVSLQGTWRLTSEEGVGADELKTRDDNGFATFLILKDDGSALYEYLGDYYAGTYKETGAGQAELDLSRARLDSAITLGSGVLSVQRSSGEALEFKKIEDSERETYDGEYGYNPVILTGGEGGETIIEELGTVLVDDEYCTITAVDSFETSRVVGYDFEIMNKTDSRLDIRNVADSFTIGGERAASNFSVELTPNASETAVAGFLSSEVGGGLDKLKDVKFQLEAIQLPGAEVVATYDISL